VLGTTQKRKMVLIDVIEPPAWEFSVLGVALGAKGFGVGRPFGFADDSLPGAGRSFDDCDPLKDFKGEQKKPHCT